MSTTDTSWPDLGRFWTIANGLSLLRLVLLVPITVLIWRDGPLSWLFGLVVVAILTDWFDGRVARWTRTVSDWGKVIDPVADKMGALLTVTALTFRAAEPHLPLWFFGVVVGRDLLILAGSALIARRSGRIVMSAWAGKAASTWLALLVLAAILKADPPIFNVCLWMTTGLLVFSFVVYVIRYLNAIRRPPPPRAVDERRGVLVLDAAARRTPPSEAESDPESDPKPDLESTTKPATESAAEPNAEAESTPKSDPESPNRPSTERSASEPAPAEASSTPTPHDSTG